jgi:hypothetical protein
VPAYYDQPSVFGNAVTEDVNRFNQLPFYLVRNEVKHFPIWSVFDQLYGEIDWQTNQGNVMKGVTPQRSPVGRSFFFPNAITTVPNKDIYQVTESVEQAVIYVHNYESFQFNFLPSFTAFWKSYLQFANKDIVEKVAISNNQFIETQMWFGSPYVYLAGYGLTSGNPNQLGNLTGTAAGSKTPNWLIATVQGTGGSGGVSQNLTLRDVYRAVMNLQEDLAAPAFEGVRNMPKDNEGLMNKYVLLLSSEAFMTFTFDKDVQTLKPLDLNLLFNDFKGSLFGTVTCKINKYPLRFSTANVTDPSGTFVIYYAGNPIPPEIYDTTDNKWKPNPYYTSLVSAPYEIAWMLGADRAKTIKVGPPPKEFTTANMAADKFYKLKWNGEVRLTDQVFITNADGSISPNVYGEQMKFISKLTHGYLEGERRYAFPIIYRRVRPSAVN